MVSATREMLEGSDQSHSHDTPDSPTIKWLGIQNMLEQAESDVLILLDCCAGASSAAEAGNGVTEVIAACGFETWAPGVSEHSFTRSLIEELQLWSDKPSNTVAMLHMRVLATMKHWKPRTGGTRVNERRKTPIHTVLGNQGHPRSIQLIPLPIEDLPLAELPAVPTERPSCESSGSETGSSGANDGNNLDSSQSSTSHLSSEPDFRPPKVLISLALEEDQWLSPNAWAEWLESVPAKVKSACVEGVYRSYSTLVLLSIPVGTWDMLPDNPAVNFIGFVIPDNLLQDAPLGGLLRQCSTVGRAQTLPTLSDWHLEELPQIEETPLEGTLSTSLPPLRPPMRPPMRPTGKLLLNHRYSCMALTSSRHPISFPLEGYSLSAFSPTLRPCQADEYPKRQRMG